MIHYVSWHVTNESDYLEQLLSPPDALRKLVRLELAFGAEIRHLEPEKITVRSEVGGETEYTLFFGTCDEMSDLVDLAAWYAKISLNCEPTIAIEVVRYVPHQMGDWPELLVDFPRGTRDYYDRVLQLAILAWKKSPPFPALLARKPLDLIDAHIIHGDMPLLEVLV